MEPVTHPHRRTVTHPYRNPTLQGTVTPSAPDLKDGATQYGTLRNKRTWRGTSVFNSPALPGRGTTHVTVLFSYLPLAPCLPRVLSVRQGEASVTPHARPSRKWVSCPTPIVSPSRADAVAPTNLPLSGAERGLGGEVAVSTFRFPCIFLPLSRTHRVRAFSPPIAPTSYPPIITPFRRGVNAPKRQSKGAIL